MTALRHFLFVVVAVLALVDASCTNEARVSDTGSPQLPRIEQIAKIQIYGEGFNRIESPESRAETLGFSAPKEHWRSILDSMRPFEKETTQVKGYSPGSVVISLSDGTEFKVGVTVFPNQEAMLLFLGPNKTSVIGGSKDRLWAAIKAAHIDTIQK